LAREIVQLVFTRLWTTESNFDEAKGQFVNWLLTITRNITIDQIRKEKKHDASKMLLMEQWEKIPDDSLATFEQFAVKEDLTQQIQYAFRYLNNNQVQLIEHLYWHGYTLSEIAQKYNEPLGTIKSRLHQSLKILRKHLQKGEG
ncbi:MAG TPA: sigma-70 family RNA polymerase sigma factor, partial [Bacilli bacterium]